jgi:hypothetical protein
LQWEVAWRWTPNLYGNKNRIFKCGDVAGETGCCSIG